MRLVFGGFVIFLAMGVAGDEEFLNLPNRATIKGDFRC